MRATGPWSPSWAWARLGAAFFLWDKALKLGDPRHIGILSYITPLASTLLLMLVSGRPLDLEHRGWRRR